MDCPGIVFARAKTAEEQADVVLRNCVKLEKLESPEVPIEAILRRVTAEQLMMQYDVGRFADRSCGSCAATLRTPRFPRRPRRAHP